MVLFFKSLVILFLPSLVFDGVRSMIAINTWNFTNATAKSWEALKSGSSALDAVEIGCLTCEQLQCDGTVGFGGSPDENGETTLDAMIMDAETHRVGAVGCLRGVKAAVSVARAVLHHTAHTMLVGDLATQFAVQMGFPRHSLSTNSSRSMHHRWRTGGCQPNFWQNVKPDPRDSCGPYTPGPDRGTVGSALPTSAWVSARAHDTIGMMAIDEQNKMAVATSTNGAAHKIPGRVGDSPVAGAGAYTSRGVGGAVATGDGDVMMRFLPTFVAVERMRAGHSPTAAATEAVQRIVHEQPDFRGAVVALSWRGEYGAACHGLDHFPYSVADRRHGDVRVVTVNCV